MIAPLLNNDDLFNIIHYADFKTLKNLCLVDSVVCRLIKTKSVIDFKNTFSFLGEFLDDLDKDLKPWSSFITFFMSSDFQLAKDLEHLIRFNSNTLKACFYIFRNNNIQVDVVNFLQFWFNVIRSMRWKIDISKNGQDSGFLTKAWYLCKIYSGFTFGDNIFNVGRNVFSEERVNQFHQMMEKDNDIKKLLKLDDPDKTQKDIDMIYSLYFHDPDKVLLHFNNLCQYPSFLTLKTKEQFVILYQSIQRDVFISNEKLNQNQHIFHQYGINCSAFNLLLSCFSSELESRISKLIEFQKDLVQDCVQKLFEKDHFDETVQLLLFERLEGIQVYLLCPKSSFFSSQGLSNIFGTLLDVDFITTLLKIHPSDQIHLTSMKKVIQPMLASSIGLNGTILYTSIFHPPDEIQGLFAKYELIQQIASDASEKNENLSIIWPTFYFFTIRLAFISILIDHPQFDQIFANFDLVTLMNNNQLNMLLETQLNDRSDFVNILKTFSYEPKNSLTCASAKISPKLMIENAIREIKTDEEKSLKSAEIFQDSSSCLIS